MAAVGHYFRIAVLLGALVGSALPTRAQVEAVTAIAAGEAMSGIVSDLSTAIRDALDRLDMSVSSATFLARMQLQILLAEVEGRSSSVIGKTFKELDESQQRFFMEARATVDRIEEMGDGLIQQVDEVVQRVEFLGGNTFLVGHEPRLRSHEPLVVVSGAQDSKEMVSVRFSGSWLANGSPSLRFGETACSVTDVKEPSINFDCPASLFVAADKMKRTQGNLVLVGDLNFLDSIFAFFGGDKKQKTYPVSIEAVPSSFGSVVVTATYTEPRVERVQRSMPFDSGARHCAWGSEQLQNITPAAGWEIDVASGVQVTVNSSSDGMHEIRNLTEAGFQFYAQGRNSGRCVSLVGAKDARGWHNGSFQWTEVQTLQDSKSVELLNTGLGWGDSRVVPLPVTQTGFVVQLKRFDGSTNEYNAIPGDDFVEITRDESGNSLKISPKKLADAFR